MTVEQVESRQQDRINYSPYHEDEINIFAILSVIWRGKFWVLGATALAAVISVGVALWLPNIYTAEVVLISEDEGGDNRLANLASQYGGIASLAGISIPSSGSTEKSIGIAKLQTRQFLGDFVERHDILPELIAAESFDWGSLELSYKHKLYDSENGEWVRKPDPPLGAVPSLQEAYLKFRDILSVNEDPETGLIRVAVEHPSPILAQNWAEWLVRDINHQMMLEATTEAQQSIDYLLVQSKRTQIVALEQVFFSLIEEQTKTIMLANVRPEYLFKTIDPAVVPEERSKPNRPLIAILGTFLGGVFGVISILVWNALYKDQ